DGDTFSIEEREEITEETMADELLGAVRANGGASWSKLRPNVRGNDGEKAEVRDRLIRDGHLVNTAPREGQFKLWVSDDPACPVPASARAGHGSSAPSPERESSGRAAVPTVSRHGFWHGTGDRSSDGLGTASLLNEERA